MRKLLYSRMDQVNNEIDVRFSYQNTKLRVAASAFQHENGNFLDVKTALPLLDLVDLTSAEAEFDVAQTYVAKSNGDEKTKLTTAKLLSEHCKALKSMLTVHLSLKLGVFLGASTAKCENSFCVLKTIMRDRRQSMKHARKAHLVQLAFEGDLTKN